MPQGQKGTETPSDGRGRTAQSQSRRKRVIKQGIVFVIAGWLAIGCDASSGKKPAGGTEAPAQQAAPQEGPAAPQGPVETSLQRVAKPSKEALVKTDDVVAQGKSKPPNILVIMGDDIGYWNVSAHSHGMMGFTTPNIDRIANEGMLFT